MSSFPYSPYASVSTEELEQMIGTKLKKLQRVELTRRIEEGDEKAREVLNAAKERQREQTKRFNQEKSRKCKQSEDIDLGATNKGNERLNVATESVANDCAGPSEASDREDLFDPAANLAENEDLDAVISLSANPSGETDLEHEAIMNFRDFYNREVAHLDDIEIEQDVAIEAGLDVAKVFLAELNPGGREIVHVDRTRNSQVRAIHVCADAKRGAEHVAVEMSLSASASMKALEDDEDQLFQELMRIRSKRSDDHA